MTLLLEQAEESGQKKFFVVLSVATGLFLGLAFPPSPLYTFAYVGLVPFLFVFERVEKYRTLLGYSYLALFLFHVLTVYWVGGFTHMRDGYLMISGGLLLLVHPMFYWIPLSGLFLVKKRFGNLIALLMFPFFWVGFEYFHSLGEFSFPWLTLGNSQAYDLYRIQLAEITSVYGISFLLILFNVLAYVLVRNISLREWKVSSRPAVISFFCLLVMYFLPFFYGVRELQNYGSFSGREPVKIGILQPNIDPFEKWEGGGYARQLTTLYDETRKISKDSLDLVVWPETAIPFYILLPENAMYWNQLKHEVDLVNTPVFTGLPDGSYVDSTTASSTAQWVEGRGKYFEGFNSATLFVPYVGNEDVYHKIRLVPFAERIPYAELFTFLVKPLKWGVGISSWGKGKEQTLFDLQLRTGISTEFGGMICYELIYPDFVRGFVQAGAEFLIVISNDSWWGNTSGAYQLAAYTSLRAVETRRWIVRCANGGISGIIDPGGRIYNKTNMYEAVTIQGSVKTMDEETFYVRYGDIVGSGCMFGSVLLVLFAARKKKVKDEFDR